MTEEEKLDNGIDDVLDDLDTVSVSQKSSEDNEQTGFIASLKSRFGL